MKFSVHQKLSNYALNLPFDVKHSEEKNTQYLFWARRAPRLLLFFIILKLNKWSNGLSFIINRYLFKLRNQQNQKTVFSNF